MKICKLLIILLLISCTNKYKKYTRIQVRPIFDIDSALLYNKAKDLLNMRAANFLGDNGCNYNIKDNGTSFLIEIKEGCSEVEHFLTVINYKGKGKLQFYISSSDESKKELIRNSKYIEPCNDATTQEIPFLIGCLSNNYNAEKDILKIQDTLKLIEEKIVTQSMFDEQQLWLLNKQTFEELDNDDILGTKEIKEDELEIKFSPQGVELLNKLIEGKQGESLVITVDDKAIYYLPIIQGMKFYEKTVIGNLHPLNLMDLKNGLSIGYTPFYFELKELN